MDAGETLLDVQDLCCTVADTEILKGVSLKVKRGEVHAIMGPNGSGKSTFSKVLVGHPSYEVTGGSATYREGEDLLDLEPEERAQQGVFLAFQYPVEIAGVSNSDFLRLAVNKRRGALGLPEYDPIEFFGVLAEKMQTVGRTRAAHPYRHPNPRPNPAPNRSPHPNPAPAQVGMSNDFIGRDVNGGFSGGEKKRNEILQVPTPPLRPAHLTEHTRSARGVHAPLRAALPPRPLAWCSASAEGAARARASATLPCHPEQMALTCHPATLQMALLEPELAILDETDSGLDIDALKTVAGGVNSYRSEDNGIILITHYQR